MTRIRYAVTRLGLQVVIIAVGMTALVGVSPAGAGAAEAGAGDATTAPAVRASSTPRIAAASAVSGVAPGWRRVMMARINALRAAAGVRPLKPCPALRRSAQEYALLMSTRDHYGHTGPDGSQPGERMLRQGYRWRTAAENIAAGQRSVDEVMAGWMNSPGHYANLVNPDLRHVGLGHASAQTGGYGDYWVQNFARGRGC